MIYEVCFSYEMSQQRPYQRMMGKHMRTYETPDQYVEHWFDHSEVLNDPDDPMLYDLLRAWSINYGLFEPFPDSIGRFDRNMSLVDIIREAEYDGELGCGYLVTDDIAVVKDVVTDLYGSLLDVWANAIGSDDLESAQRLLIQAQ